MPDLSQISRRLSQSVPVAGIQIGGGAPIVVQSMTNTETAGTVATAIQDAQLAKAGSELVRITVNTEQAAAGVAEIRARLDRMGVDVPLIGDFHYNGHKLLDRHPECAAALAKYRINPGNVGRGQKRDEQFATIIEHACRHDKPVRIGVNWGSLDQDLLARMMDDNSQRTQPLDPAGVTREALISSALDSAAYAEQLGLAHDRIVLSVKVSDVQDLIAVYSAIAERCNYPLHLGLTEAGMGSKGIVASVAALSVLLQRGIGDTIRVSLTPEPEASRTQEVTVCQQILQTMGLRAFTPQVTACPGCGRTSSDYFQHLARDIQNYLGEMMPHWKNRFPGVEELSVAVMGCVVNGPGESKRANVGISLPGSGERPVAPVYIDGEKSVTLRGDQIAQQFQEILDDYVVRHYSPNRDAASQANVDSSCTPA